MGNKEIPKGVWIGIGVGIGLGLTKLGEAISTGIVNLANRKEKKRKLSGVTDEEKK